MELIHQLTNGPRPTSQFDLVDDGKKIGMLQLRHTHGSPSLGMPEGFGNNIYYEIEPEYREKGNGKKILALGLDEARKIGLKEVRLTVFEDNPSSFFTFRFSLFIISSTFSTILLILGPKKSRPNLIACSRLCCL